MPGAGIRAALGNVNRGLGLVNVLGNVAMFVPLGFLLPLATRVGPGGDVALCAALSTSIELSQAMLGRNLDVDDVLLNTLGAAVGATSGGALVALVHWRRRRAPHTGT